MTIDPFDFGFQEGISQIKAGKLLDRDSFSLAVASQAGELKIVEYSSGELSLISELDLTENGAIWALKVADFNHDELDEILVGGMQGALVCLSVRGDEIWNFDRIVHQCASGISGIKIWNDAPLFQEDSDKGPISVSFSLDKTIRVFDCNGLMQWSQMFSAGVGCINFGDTNGDRKQELVAGGNDGTLRVFDGLSGKLLWFKELHSNIRDLLCSKGYIVCGGDNRQIIVINGKTQEIITQKDFPTYVWLMKRSKDTLFASTYSFNYIGMEDPTAGEPSVGCYKIPSLEEAWIHDTFNCQDICFCEEMNLLFCAGTDGTLKVISISDGTSTHYDVGSLINTISYIPPAKEDDLVDIIAGADDMKVYHIKHPIKN